MRVKLQLVLCSDDGQEAIITDIVTLKKDAQRIEHLGLTLKEAKQLLNTMQKRLLQHQVAVFLDGLLDAQGVKTLRRRRLVEVKPHVVFGTQAAVEQVLAACGWQSNTTCVERLHLRLRQRVAALGRRSATPCKSADGWGQQLVLCQGYHTFVLPHASVRRALAESVPTNGRGSAKVGQPCTPAMAAGRTDHVWSLREVLLFRVPPWPQPQTISNMAWGDDRGGKRLRCAHMQPQRVERSAENPFAVLRTG